MAEEPCTRCDRTVPSYDGVVRSDGKGNSLGFVCGRCWSDILSEARGEDVGHLELEPVLMRDAAGHEHEFHFRYSPVPRGVEAFEIVDGAPGGYRFQVLEEGNEPGIVQRLLDRMRRALTMRHLEPSDLMPGRLQVKGFTVRGRVEWDPEEEGIPSVVVDGKPLAWIELGEMLMTFEGWQFRLEILDKSEEA